MDTPLSAGWGEAMAAVAKRATRMVVNCIVVVARVVLMIWV